jgi:hypothetical protein
MSCNTTLKQNTITYFVTLPILFAAISCMSCVIFTVTNTKVAVWNIFTHDMLTVCVDMAGGHARIIGGIKILGLLFADDFAVASYTSSGLQNKIDLARKYFNGWDLRCNLEKPKIIFFRKDGN